MVTMLVSQAKEKRKLNKETNAKKWEIMLMEKA